MLIIGQLLSPTTAFRSVNPLQRPASSQRTLQKLYFFQNLLESFTLAPSNNNNNNSNKALREGLKAQLLDECQLGKNAKRANIEAIIEQLKELNPTSASASSPLLQKYWALEWTTEKEINFFLDWGLSNEIGQTIAGPKINNNIEFVRGGGFYVSGKLNIPDPNGPRTEFEFETATLDLGKWGNFEFPPVGAGWFDTVYLDETLRVDLNSRDDILICTPGESN